MFVVSEPAATAWTILIIVNAFGWLSCMVLLARILDNVDSDFDLDSED